MKMRRQKLQRIERKQTSSTLLRMLCVLLMRNNLHNHRRWIDDESVIIFIALNFTANATNEQILPTRL